MVANLRQASESWRIGPLDAAWFRVILCLPFLIPGTAFAFTEAEIDQAANVARQIDIVSVIADDVYRGRDNNTPESAAIQAILIDELSALSEGLNSSQTGDAAFRQVFASGTNILAVIPGTDLAYEYVMIGAHYDHIGASGSVIFNGATDNAAGVAVVLAVAAAIDALPTPPRRSVILALWDAEEDWMLGSSAYADAPLVPLANTVAYVNIDLQGANLLPSLRSLSFAIGGESGGNALQSLVEDAVARESLDTRQLSRLFGQDRGDHASFIDRGVPSVFLSDATGACYHTPGDDITVVDFEKLREEAQIAFRLTLALAEAPVPPSFVPTSLLFATYEDAVTITDVLDGAAGADLALFSSTEQAIILNAQASLRAIVDAGPGNFGLEDITTLGLAVLDLINALATLPCDVYLLTPTPTPTATVTPTPTPTSGTPTPTPTPAPPAQLDKDQQKCVNEMNKNGAKVNKAQLKENGTCLKDFQKGKLTTSFDACITADRKGKIDQAQDKTVVGEAKKCATLLLPPPFAYTDATTVNENAVDGALALTHTIFGGPPVQDTVFSTKVADKDKAKCQLGMLKQASKLENTVLKEINKAKKEAIKKEWVGSSSLLETALADVFTNSDKVTSAAAKLVKGVEKKCASLQDPATTFPGACADPNLGVVEECEVAAARCVACLKINAFDDLSLDCDDLDDGAANMSCP